MTCYDEQRLRTMLLRGGCALIGIHCALVLVLVSCSYAAESSQPEAAAAREGAYESVGVAAAVDNAVTEGEERMAGEKSELGGEPDSVTALLEFYSRGKRPLNASRLLPVSPTCLKVPDPLNSGPAPQPRCEAGKGCDTPLHCYDFGREGVGSIVPHPPQAVDVTPHRLESILEDPAVANCCAVVMFYAPWCEFSARFARRFNALGRTFDGLPVLAVDFSKQDPHKYVLAYLPVVAFYYRARVLFQFKLSASYEELRSAVANITGFTPRELDISDEENSSPVPTERDGSDRYFLYLATAWLLALVVVTCALRTSQAAALMQRYRAMLLARALAPAD